jgi:uncharacterized protein (TIGR03643 family)
MTNRSVFFVSDGTGITAETFGNAILAQFGLSEVETISTMKASLPLKRFEAWRDRVYAHGDLKDRGARGFKLGVFKSRMQRLDGTIKRGK